MIIKREWGPRILALPPPLRNIKVLFLNRGQSAKRTTRYSTDHHLPLPPISLPEKGLFRPTHERHLFANRPAHSRMGRFAGRPVQPRTGRPAGERVRVEIFFSTILIRIQLIETQKKYDKYRDLTKSKFKTGI